MIVQILSPAQLTVESLTFTHQTFRTVRAFHEFQMLPIQISNTLSVNHRLYVHRTRELVPLAIVVSPIAVD